MKSLIIYSSQTGNTKKLADAVYQNLSGEKDIYDIDEAPDPNQYDFVAIGFWLMAGKPDPKSQEYLKRIKADQSVFLFATHGAAAESDHAKKAMDYAKTLIPKGIMKEQFSCQGEVNPKVMEKIKAKENPPEWIGDAPEGKGHPDKGDFDSLKKIIKALNVTMRLFT